MVDPAPPEQDLADEHATVMLGAPARAMAAIPRRLAIARTTLQSPEERPLSDLERIAAGRSIDRLLHAIEIDLRARMLNHPAFPAGEELRQSFGSTRVAIAAKVLAGAGLALDTDLVGSVLRHIAMQRLEIALVRQGGGGDDDPVDAFLESGNAERVKAATSLMIARNCGHDRSEMPDFGEDDLAEPQRRALYYRVAAALRDYAVGIHGAEAMVFDDIALWAADAALASRQPVQTVAAAAELAALIEPTDELCLQCVRHGHLWLYAALLARRADLEVETVADLLAADSGAAHLVVLAAADVRRDSAAELQLHVAHALERDNMADGAVVELMQGYEAVSGDRAQRALDICRADPAYRQTLTALSEPAIQRKR